MLNNFTAACISDEELNATAVGGNFSHTAKITPATESVTIAIGAFSLTFAPGAFKLNRSGGGYSAVAKVTRSQKIAMALQPLPEGNWEYSAAAIQGFVPGANPIIVSLIIGTQAGSAQIDAYIL
jgi:hypothetical protein